MPGQGEPALTGAYGRTKLRRCALNLVNPSDDVGRGERRIDVEGYGIRAVVVLTDSHGALRIVTDPEVGKHHVRAVPRAYADLLIVEAPLEPAVPCDPGHLHRIGVEWQGSHGPLGNGKAFNT